MSTFSGKLHNLLFQPWKVFLACLCFAILSLLMNGGLYNLYKLHRDTDILNQQIASTQAQLKNLDLQLKLAKDPAFLERQAVDRYELADEHDLVFVFPDE